jgi:hypothetical protein
MIDLPDFSTPLRSIAGSVRKLAGLPPDPDPSEPPGEIPAHGAAADVSDTTKAPAIKTEEPRHA